MSAELSKDQAAPGSSPRFGIPSPDAEAGERPFRDGAGERSERRRQWPYDDKPHSEWRPSCRLAASHVEGKAARSTCAVSGQVQP